MVDSNSNGFNCFGSAPGDNNPDSIIRDPFLSIWSSLNSTKNPIPDTTAESSFPFFSNTYGTEETSFIPTSLAFEIPTSDIGIGNNSFTSYNNSHFDPFSSIWSSSTSSSAGNHASPGPILSELNTCHAFSQIPDAFTSPGLFGNNFETTVSSTDNNWNITQNNGYQNHTNGTNGFTHNFTNIITESEVTEEPGCEVGIVDKLLRTYGFIKATDNQTRLFFHFSNFIGIVEHLKQGDTVEFQKTTDRKTCKPIAINVTKVEHFIAKGDGERLTGIVTSEVSFETNGKFRGRITHEFNGECFFLPFGREDVEGNAQLKVGDAVSFQIETSRTGVLIARFVHLEEPPLPEPRYNGFVTLINDSFGFIESLDGSKKICFLISDSGYQKIMVGDIVEFNIQMKNGQEYATNITKKSQPSRSSDDRAIVDSIASIQAEQRLAARRQARAEAREIRMRELEKQQKESDENADKQYDMYSSDVVNRAAFRVAIGSHRSQAHSIGSASYHSSRRSSEDSSEDGIISLRDMRHELKELEDKFRKSMVQNAQLDNEKASLTYQVELLKDKIEDIEETLSQLQREHKDKCREYENLKRLLSQLKDELEYYKAQLLERDELIKDYGLVVVESEVEVDLGNGDRETRIKRNLVTQQSADVLSTLGTGSLDVRLKKVMEENNDLQDEIRRLKLDLEEERSRTNRGEYANHNSVNNSHSNGPEDDFEIQREAGKLVAEYKFKVQKYEQEIATLQANVARLDGQVTRFKTSSEEAESREDDLKVDKRKLQRELREAQSRLDELETTNSHLQKRLDKLKTAKSTLLKEL